MSCVIEAKGLTKQYQQGDSTFNAVQDVDLTVVRGEFVAVMGPSGCGGSTLLNLLAGLDRPTSGEVWIDGERIDQKNESALARLLRRIRCWRCWRRAWRCRSDSGCSRRCLEAVDSSGSVNPATPWLLIRAIPLTIASLVWAITALIARGATNAPAAEALHRD